MGCLGRKCPFSFPFLLFSFFCISLSFAAVRTTHSCKLVWQSAPPRIAVHISPSTKALIMDLHKISSKMLLSQKKRKQMNWNKHPFQPHIYVYRMLLSGKRQSIWIERKNPSSFIFTSVRCSFLRTIENKWIEENKWYEIEFRTW